MHWAGQCSPWALPAGLNDGKYLQCWGIHGILCIDMKLQIKRNEIWITKQKWNDHENWIFMAMLEGSLVEKGTWESNRQSLWIFIQSCTAGIEEGLRRKSSVPPRWRRSYKLIQNQIWFKKAKKGQYSFNIWMTTNLDSDQKCGVTCVELSWQKFGTTLENKLLFNF